MSGRKESSFCEQKEAKKLFPFLAVSGFVAPGAVERSFFGSFFSKKEQAFLLSEALS
jgi:hypothetical protein